MHELAPDARISPLADLEHSSRGSRLCVGANSSIDAFVKIKFTGGSGDVIIGERSYINSGVVIYSGNGVRIGNNVLIAANCTLAPVNHEYRRRGTLIIEQRFMPSKGGILIEDDVWIGANCVVADGAVIGRGAVIGACSLVRGVVEPYSINVGVPTRITGYRE